MCCVRRVLPPPPSPPNPQIPVYIPCRSVPYSVTFSSGGRRTSCTAHCARGVLCVWSTHHSVCTVYCTVCYPVMVVQFVMRHLCVVLIDGALFWGYLLEAL